MKHSFVSGTQPDKTFHVFEHLSWTALHMMLILARKSFHHS